MGSEDKCPTERTTEAGEGTGWAPPFKVETEAFSCLPTSQPSAYRDPGVREVGEKGCLG